MRPRLVLAAVAITASLVGPSLAGAPPEGGTISIAATTADGEYDASLPVYVDAVATALSARGFTILDAPGHAASTLDLTLSRTDVGTAPSRVAGQSKVAVGGGIAVPFSTGKSDLVPIRRVRLDLRLRKRGETAIVWHAAAVTVRKAGMDKAVATDLGHALLQNYPAEPPGVVGVP